MLGERGGGDNGKKGWMAGVGGEQWGGGLGAAAVRGRRAGEEMRADVMGKRMVGGIGV